MFSLFNKIKNENNPDLALKLFETLSVSTNKLSYLEEKQINSILKECNCRQDILNKVIQICGNPTTPKQRYIYAITYAWSIKEYREKAIQYLELYLSNPLYEDIYLHRLKYYEQTIEERKNNHLIIMYKYLGDLYEKVYDFKKALTIAEKMIDIDRSNPTGYMLKSSILIKQNKLKELKTWLEQQKNLPYYRLNKKYSETSSENFFFFTINRLLKDVEDKIEKSYIYKPRNKSSS